MLIKEQIEVVDGGVIKFNSSVCDNCANFTGTSTCRINTERIYYPDKIVNVEVLRYLERDNATSGPCNLVREVKIVEKGFTLKGGDKNIELAVLQYMKKYCRDSKELTVNNPNFKRVMHSIKLFKDGEVENLINLYPFMITNASNNPWYSKPFEYFTGVRFYELGSTSGNKSLENKTFNFLRDMCKHRKVLNRMVNAYIKYAPNDRDPVNFTYNFHNFFTELLFGKNVRDFYNYNRDTRWATVGNTWGYVGNYREALKEAGCFSDDELPLPNYLNNNYKNFETVKEVFVAKAHLKLSNEFVSV